MPTVSNANFGPLIAYLVPGAVALSGLVPFSPTLEKWFATSLADAPTLGGFLYLTVASLTSGMTVSALRWAALDSLHARTGLAPPRLDFSRLGPNVEALSLLIDIHYRHYLFYANMFVATAIAYVGYRISLGDLHSVGPSDVGIAALEVVFFATSRDTLRKYYRRSEQLLRPSRGGRMSRGEERPVTPPSRSRVPGGRRTR